MNIINHLQIQALRGVGNVELNLTDDRQVYSIIGDNGIGKTKLLEALFQFIIYQHDTAIRQVQHSGISSKVSVFREIRQNNEILLTAPSENFSLHNLNAKNQHTKFNQPVVFIGSQNRGFIQHANTSSKPIGTFEQRQKTYIAHLIQSMENNFANLNMDTNIEEWFITRAKSANPYQKQEDNREIELKIVLILLHEIDERINPEFMQISGDEQVSILIDGQQRLLSQLSTGFASILKIIQSIVSGFAYFTNETQLQSVKGIVLIDEIESHLHLSWQAKIIPILKRLFPNTTFYITTHSSIIFSQLKTGEAYRLQRDHDGVVRTQLIESPANASMVDLLKDAFGINLNQLKLNQVLPEDQQHAKSALLALIQEA